MNFLLWHDLLFAYEEKLTRRIQFKLGAINGAYLLLGSDQTCAAYLKCRWSMDSPLVRALARLQYRRACGFERRANNWSSKAWHLQWRTKWIPIEHKKYALLLLSWGFETDGPLNGVPLIRQAAELFVGELNSLRRG
jgi:hypothetical protein